MDSRDRRIYNGTITALDDQGRKEAVLRFKNGKYQGTISKWDEDGKLWEEGEFDRGILVTFTSKKENLLIPTKSSICPKIRRWQAYSSKSKKLNSIYLLWHAKCLNPSILHVFSRQQPAGSWRLLPKFVVR